METNEKEFIALSLLGMCGRMISDSKSGYMQRNPRNFAIFNANVCTKIEKIWFGDLDVTLSKQVLSQLAQKLNEDIYVLYEMDGRFENEDKPLIQRHVVNFTSEGNMKLGSSYTFLLEENRYDL